ncbi:MAG: N-acetylmuramoyl-L-alanine amidase [Armatimonadetes bacterium]|nr:N-acetylmuramoyl-L-alanine amidase [Armatimonadota bacterium]
MKQSIAASIILLLTVVLITGAHAELVPVRILIGTREAIAAPSAVFDGNRVLGSVNILESLGATHDSEIGGKMSITNALGRTSDIETVRIKGSTMLPMNKVAEAIGLDYAWNAENRTLTLTARLESVEFADGVLKINCTIPVSCKVNHWSANNKLIIDIGSTKIATPANEVFIGSSLISRARLGQSDDTTARVVLDLEKDVSYKVNSAPLDAKIDISVSDKTEGAAAIPPAIGISKPFTVSDIKIEQLDDMRFQIVMSTSNKGSLNAAYAVKPAKIVLKLPACSLADTAKSYSGSHPLLSDMKITQDPASRVTRLELSLKRTMICDTSIDENSITALVRPPDKSGGALAEKLIVIDPGHGGIQPGAKSGSILEKDINLAIAREVADSLQKLGAKVILTRSTDQAVGLPERPGAAVDSGADIFISIHCNSNGTRNNLTGIETYYHMLEPSSRLLAEAVHDNVCTITGMCDRSARSDGRLYAGGLAVLRRLEGTGIPGFLVECGYLNNASDCSKLCSADYRKKVAQGIIKGVREYIEGN